VRPNAEQNAKETDHAAEIEALISELSCDDDAARSHAMSHLVALGRDASPALTRALAAERVGLRWRAAWALGKIADPATTPDLLRALEDEDIGVRWLAAEALSSIGAPALAPLLERLIHRADSVLFREGTTHVLLSHADGPLAQAVRRVLRALDHPASEVAAPVAAYEMLEEVHDRARDARPSASSSA
jgi:HEAT repeat protein